VKTLRCLVLILLLPCISQAASVNTGTPNIHDFNVSVEPVKLADNPEGKQILCLSSFLLSVPLILLGTHATMDEGKGMFLFAGGICALNGTLCLVKF
jgi:hypothetical protein